MKKRIGIFIFVLIGIYLVSFISAAVCEDNQTILRLYNSTNSHAAVWNQSTGTYLEEICYNDIFGIDYVGVNPHICTGSNSVIYLSDSSNAHGAISTDGIAPPMYSVCYGDLSCTYHNGACPNGKIAILKLSGTLSPWYNYHFSNVNDSNYVVNICCSSAYNDSIGTPLQPLSQVRWEDADGNLIGETAGVESNLYDEVRMVFENSEYPQGTQVAFRVYEDDLPFPFGDGDDEIQSINGVVDSSGKVVGVWLISDDDLDKTNDLGEFRFDVINNSGITITSDDLAVNSTPREVPLNLLISSPPCGADIFSNGTLDIVILATDIDNIIHGSLDIFDSSGASIDSYNFSNGGLDLSDYSFGGAFGNFKIVAFATSIEGDRVRKIANVMVINPYVNGAYVSACISSPADFSNIPGSEVYFDVKNTKAISYSVAGGKTNIPITNLNFYWVFSDGRTNPYVSGVDSRAYDFYKRFQEAGNNWATLRVEVVD